MNENINLCEILKDCPEGTELYSSIHGKVLFSGIDKSNICSIEVIANGYADKDFMASFTADGRYLHFCAAECVLFPSKDQRDWSKFTAPWYKKKRFNPKTLKPFDKVLIKDSYGNWSCDLFSYIKKENIDCKYVASGFCSYTYCIPYNNDTKHLIGTADEVPEYYKYWED